MLEKRNSRNVYLLTLSLLINKDATFWLWNHVMANLTRKTCNKLYQNRPCFVKDMTKTFWCVFSVHSSNCCSLAKRECWVSQGRLETLFRWGEKRLHFCATNLLWTICTKFYHRFCRVYIKNILVFFWFTVYLYLSSGRYSVVKTYSNTFYSYAPYNNHRVSLNILFVPYKTKPIGPYSFESDIDQYNMHHHNGT